MMSRGIFKISGLPGLALAAAMLLSQPAAADDMVTTKDTLLDRIQIEDLMIDYYWTLTSDERHEITKYWAEDAVFDVNGIIMEGRAAIQEAYDTVENELIAPNAKFNMLLNNPRIRVDGDTAVMDAIWTGTISDNKWATPRFVEQGSEHTEFVKQDGRWRIKKRVLRQHGGMSEAWSGD